MASSSIALRRASTSRLLFTNLLRPASRSFNTDSQVVDVDRPPDRSVSHRHDASSSFSPDVFDPFSPTRSLSQLLNLMDQFMENPFVSPADSRRGWVAKEDDDKLTLIMNMPGVGKEDVKVTVQQNTLIIKGEAQKESSGGDDDSSSSSEGGTRRKYSSKIDLHPNLHKLDEIKAEMKNGVLKILVSKVKEEEARNVIQVNVE